MKETKVYVDELPKSCVGCPCCSCDLKPEFIKIGDIMYCNLLKQKFRFKEERKKLKDCPLQSLKTHDRELVRQVCEKIEDWCNKNFNWVGDGTGYDGQDYNEMIGSNNTINKLRGFLNQIQKEYEK